MTRRFFRFSFHAASRNETLQVFMFPAALQRFQAEAFKYSAAAAAAPSCCGMVYCHCPLRAPRPSGSFISIHCCLTSGKDVISEAANQSGPRRTGSRGNPVRAGRTGPASLRPDAAQRETRRDPGLVFHCWPAAQEQPGIFMRPNCVQMLIFKQEYQVRRCSAWRTNGCSCQELKQTL